MITPQGSYLMSLFSQVDDEIDYRFAVRPAIDVIADAVDHVGFPDLDFVKDQLVEGVDTTVDVADGYDAGHGCKIGRE